MKNESVKKSLVSKNVLEEKRKIVKPKFCMKTHTFTIIAMNFVQEQLNIAQQLKRIKIPIYLQSQKQMKRPQNVRKKKIFRVIF